MGFAPSHNGPTMKDRLGAGVLAALLALALASVLMATLDHASVAQASGLRQVTLPTVQFSTAAYSASEGSGGATITVTLSAASSNTATVSVSTGDGTATAGGDYTPISRTLTFTPSVTSLTFTVPITNDTFYEGNETLALTLSDPVSATLGSPASASLTLVDDESPPTLQFSGSSYSVNENAGPAVITTTLTGATAVTATVTVTTSNGTATAGSDYTAITRTLTFTPGVTSVTFTVPITNDTIFETNETLALRLSSPVSATLGTPNTAALTIVNDDPLPVVQFSANTYSVTEGTPSATITVALSHPSVFTATVNFATSNGSAVAPGDYLTATGTLTFAPLATSQAFNVTITNDDIGEPDEALTLTLSSPVSATLTGGVNPATLVILDDEGLPTVRFTSAANSVNEGAGPASVQVFLSHPSALTATVVVTSANGTALAGSDYTAISTTLSFAPGDLFESASVPITNDTTYEGNETLALALSSPVNAVLGTTHRTTTLTIVDDDPQPTVQFSAAAYSVNEGASPAVISVVLSNPSVLTATVRYATSNGTATAGSDYVTATGTLTFPPLVTLRTFNVTITNDTLYEGNEALTLTLSNPNSNTSLGSPNPATLTIVENDAPPTIRLSAAAFTVGENTGPVVLTATLMLTGGTTSTAVTATVNYATSNGTATAGSDFTAVNNTLSFPPGVTSQTMVVPLMDDAVFEDFETFSLALSSPSHAVLGSPTQAVVTVADDDPRPSCNIFSSPDVPKPIPDNNPAGVESLLVVPAPSQVIGDVSVRLGHLQHTSTGDLQIYLVAPDQTTILIVDKAGGFGNDFLYTILNDAHALRVDDASAPFTGNFHPHDPLALLHDLPSAGTWRLRVVDGADRDVGTLHAWALEVCGSVSHRLHLPLIMR